ncbi:MAG: hypothetical protein ACK5PF_01055, partial [bacterium]
AHSSIGLYVDFAWGRVTSAGSGLSVTATLGAARPYKGICVVQLRGAADSLADWESIERLSSDSVGPFSTPALSFSKAGIIVGFTCPYVGRSFTPDSPAVEIYDPASYYTGAMSRDVSGGGSVSIGTTVSSNFDGFVVALGFEVGGDPLYSFQGNAFQFGQYIAPATSTTTLTGDPGALTLTGQTGTFRVTLSGSPGSLSLTGGAITVRELVASSPGTLTLTGSTGVFSELLAASPGTLPLTGLTINFTIGTALPVTPGTLTLTGSTGTFEHRLAASPGALTLTGSTITFSVAQRLTADPGTLTLTGGTATFTEAVAGSPGTLTLSGATATFRVTVDGQPGALTLTGANVTLTVTSANTEVELSPGSLVLTGSDATFTVEFDPIAYMGARPTVQAGSQGGGLQKRAYSKTRFRQENMKWPSKG